MIHRTNVEKIWYIVRRYSNSMTTRNVFMFEALRMFDVMNSEKDKHLRRVVFMNIMDYVCTGIHFVHKEPALSKAIYDKLLYLIFVEQITEFEHYFVKLFGPISRALLARYSTCAWSA